MHNSRHVFMHSSRHIYMHSIRHICMHGSRHICMYGSRHIYMHSSRHMPSQMSSRSSVFLQVSSGKWKLWLNWRLTCIRTHPRSPAAGSRWLAVSAALRPAQRTWLPSTSCWSWWMLLLRPIRIWCVFCLMAVGIRLLISSRTSSSPSYTFRCQPEYM